MAKIPKRPKEAFKLPIYRWQDKEELLMALTCTEAQSSVLIFLYCIFSLYFSISLPHHSLYLLVAKALHQVVIDESCGLHVRIDGSAAKEFEPSLFEIFGKFV